MVERIDPGASNSRFLCPADIGQIESRSGSGRQAPVGHAPKPGGDHLGREAPVLAGRTGYPLRQTQTTLPDLGGYPRDRVFRSNIYVFLDLRPLNKPEFFANAFSDSFDPDGNLIDD